jgi:hypothetical protein
LKYAGTAFIALGDEARAEFLAEVERLTNESDAMGCSPLTPVCRLHQFGVIVVSDR